MAAAAAQNLRSSPYDSVTERLEIVRAQWHLIQEFYSEVQECVDDAKVEELGRTRLPSVEAALNRVLDSLLEEKAEMATAIYMGSCVASRTAEPADGRDRISMSSFNEDAEVGFLPPCYRYLLGDHQKRLRELRRRQLAIQEQASKMAASRLDKSPGRLAGGKESDSKSTSAKPKVGKDAAKAAAAAQRRLKVEQEELEMMGGAPSPGPIPAESAAQNETPTQAQLPDRLEIGSALPKDAEQGTFATTRSTIEAGVQKSESNEPNAAASADDGRELILSVCQYAKLDVPVGSRQVMMRFLTRFVREADIFPPLPLLANSGKAPRSSPDAVRSIAALVEREGFESIPSLLELFPELISVPLCDMIKRVGSALDPSASHPPQSYLAYKNTTRRGGSEQRISHSRRSSLGSHISGVGHEDPNKHGAAEMRAQPRSGASVPTRVSQYADRLDFVSLLHALAQRIEQKPELAKFFMYTVEVSANAAEEWVASVATQARSDGTTTPSVARGGSSERWRDHEGTESDYRSNSAQDDATPMLQKHSRCILLDFLPLYARDYAVGLALPQRDVASRLALEGILCLTYCTSPDVQDTVARESTIAYIVASEFRTTLLTLCKVPQNIESRTQLAYIIAVTRFWGTLVLRSPRVALAWDVLEVFSTRILRDTILPLLKSTESRVYSAVCALLATIARELCDASSLVESIVKTLFSARVVLSTGQIYVAASDAPSSATETASFAEEYVIARLKESSSVSWGGTSFAFSGSRAQAQQRPPVTREAYVAMESTLVLLNSLAISCPHYFLKYALGVQMESIKSVATKFHDLVDKYAIAHGLHGEEALAQKSEGDASKPAAASPTNLKRRSRRVRRQEKRSMLRVFGSRLCAMGLCSRGDTHITLSARVAAPPIVLAECFPSRIRTSSELCGSAEEDFSEDILEKLLAIEVNVPAEVLIRRQRDLQVPICTSHIPVKPAPLSSIEAAENAKAASYGLRQVSSTFAGYSAEDMEVNVALLPSTATTPQLASSTSGFNHSETSAGGGASEAVESSSPTSPSAVNVAYLHKASGNAVTFSSIAGSGTSNIWFHQGIHQAPVIVAVCGTVARMHELPLAVNVSVTNLVSTLCLLPDLRVLYTLMDAEYGRLDHALHKLSSVIDAELDEDEQVQLAAAAAAIANASTSGGMSTSSIAKDNLALTPESIVRGGGVPSPLTGKVAQVVPGGTSASTARSHSDPNSSQRWPSGMRSGGGQVMDNLTALEHSRLQVFQWYCVLNEQSRTNLMYSLVASAELQRKQEQLKGAAAHDAPPAPPQVSKPAPTKSRGFFNFFSSGSNRSNEARSGSSGVSDVAQQNNASAADAVSQVKQEKERDSLFTAAFLKHRYFIEACVCLEGFRHELNAIVAYTALSHNLLGLSM